MMVVSAFVLEVSRIITKLQDIVTLKLHNFCKYSLENENQVIKDLKLMAKMYKHFCNVTSHINSIFGAQFFLIFSIIFIQSLKNIDEVLTLVYSKDDGLVLKMKQIYIREMLLGATLAVISVSIAIAGDKIEKTGIKITKLCHILEVDIKNPIIRGHVRNLSGYLEKLRPALTLAGFIPINRNIIPLLLSSLTSYAIILIQLKS
ncbi:unnamed protein product [Diabrotica balteata]|uniref:Uncharacterized protein n=1 Tax=Diabrotica balteata TaxID=107213 RepID=A0A9N9TCX4_DIABA|nr:unnamed protein product [Diabrotica balteata]